MLEKTRKRPRIKIPELTEAELTVTPEDIKIAPPKLRTAKVTIVGISPYVQHAFSEKARVQMEEKQKSGQQARGKKVREPKNFEAVYRAAQHRAKQGWLGIPCPAFRNAAISACRLVGFKMTHAKLSLFIEADGIDVVDATPLVRIIGEPRIHKGYARNESGVADIRWRPLWEKWSAVVTITWDEDQFSATDVINLMHRSGLQVGIGEGRPDSPNSNGLGWGRFKVEGGLVDDK